MILHIFNKDLRRLWPFVVGLVLVDFAYAIMRVAVGPFPDVHSDLDAASQFVGLVAVLLTVFLTVMAVQLDPLPDDRQDWLVRPIKRRDLLCAKLLFVIVLIQGPMLADDIVQGLATGFPIGQTLAAALTLNLYQFATLTLPAMAIAALTRTIGHTLGLGVAVFAGVLAVAGGTLLLYQRINITPDNAHTSTSFVLETAVLLAGAAAILGLQYFRRATLAGRVSLAAAAILAAGAQLLLPQNAAYAVENWFSSVPGQNISLSFDPAAGRSVRKESEGEMLDRLDGNTAIYLPLRVEGVPPGTMLVAAETTATWVTPDGRRNRNGESEKIIQAGPNGASAPYYQVLRVSNEFLRTHGDQPVRLELDFVLNVLRPGRSYELAATGGDLRIPDVGWCATGLDRETGTAVNLRCLQAGQEQTGLTAALVNHVTGLRNPAVVEYTPNQPPYRSGADMLTNFGSSLPFAGRNAPDHAPVGPQQLSMSTVAVTISQPLTRIVRHITIPAIRLSDWKAVTEKPSP